MKKYVIVTMILLISFLPCMVNASRFLMKPTSYTYTPKVSDAPAPDAQYTKYTIQNTQPKLSDSILAAAQKTSSPSLSDMDLDLEDLPSQTSDSKTVNQSGISSQPQAFSWKNLVLGQNFAKRPEPVAVAPEVVSPAKSLNLNIASQKGEVLIPQKQDNSVAKFNEQSLNQETVAPQINQPVQVNQGSNDVVKQQILSKIPTLNDENVTKVAELVGIIKEADIKTSGQLMSLPKYTTAKNESFPEGLPEGVTPKLLFDIGKNSGSDNASATAMSQIQQGKQLEAVKQSVPAQQSVPVEQPYVFDSVAAMMKAQSKVVSDAQNAIKQSLKSQATAKFDKDAWQENFKAENQADVNQPGFDQMMQQNMDKELQAQVDQAYQDNNAQIEDAGNVAAAQFKSNVDAATKAKSASAKSQSKNNVANQQQLASSAKTNQLKSAAVKQQKALINQQVEQQFTTQGFNVEVPRDNGTHQMMVMTKAQWIKSYATWHPKATSEEITAKVNDVVTELQATAYKTPENVATIQAAQDNAVAKSQSQSAQGKGKLQLPARPSSPTSVATLDFQ